MNSEKLHPAGCASEKLHAAGCVCHSKIDLGVQLHVIASLSQAFSLIISPDIEEEMTCALNCCLMKDAINYIDILTDYCVAEDQSIVGNAEREMLRSLKGILCAFPYSENEKGFSKTQDWLDFVEVINIVHSRLSVTVSLFHFTDIMHSESRVIVKKHCDTFNDLCDILDVLVSPTVEEDIEEEPCSLEVCCISNHKVLPYFKQIIIRLEFLFFTESYIHEKQSVLGEVELKILRQLYKTLKSIHHYNDKEGFSKKQSWLDLVAFMNGVNVVLKDAAKRYTEKTLIKT